MSKNYHHSHHLHPTSILNSVHLHEKSSDLEIHSNMKIEKATGQKPTSLQNGLADFLIRKLLLLEEKQKQNENKFLDCIEILKSQVALKDKINQSLKDQITSLREELIHLKSILDELIKIQQNFTGTNVKSITQPKKNLRSPKHQSPFRITSPQSGEKQNFSPYMLETLRSSRHFKKLTQAQAKTSELNHEKNPKLQFKLQNFIKQSKPTNVDEYFHDHMSFNIQEKKGQERTDKIPFRLKNSTCTRKSKSKSIGGILRAKMFLS